MTNLVDIVESIIDSIDLNIKVKSITGNKLFVCGSTLFLTITKVVTIEGKEYQIVDFEINNWIEVTPKGHSDNLTGDEKIIVAPKITFIQGSPYSANNEYLMRNTQTLEKTPFIWLLEGYEFDNLPRDSSLETMFSAKIFFLDWANEVEWLNKTHNERVIKPMQNLLDAFTNAINENFSFKNLGKVKGVVRPRFGVYFKEQNQDAKPQMKIIDEDLSGLEANIKIEVYDTDNCLCT